MPSRELPARPNLEQLKKQAKSLLDAAKAREPAIDVADLALHDAQSAIAREHGFASWNELREEVGLIELRRDAAVEPAAH